MVDRADVRIGLPPGSEIGGGGGVGTATGGLSKESLYSQDFVFFPPVRQQENITGFLAWFMGFLDRFALLPPLAPMSASVRTVQKSLRELRALRQLHGQRKDEDAEFDCIAQALAVLEEESENLDLVDAQLLSLIRT